MSHQDTLLATIQPFLATPPYRACLLLLHTDPTRLAETAAWLKQTFAWPEWPVGNALSLALLDMAPQDRPGAAARWFRETAAAHRPGPVLLDDVPLLFEPALELDPLRLILDASRQTQFIVVWPGAVAGNRLSYAVPEHNHYRTWPKSDLCPHCVLTL